MKRLAAVILMLSLSIIFTFAGEGRAEDPAGVLGFKWGDTEKTARDKAQKMGLRTLYNDKDSKRRYVTKQVYAGRIFSTKSEAEIFFFDGQLYQVRFVFEPGAVLYPNLKRAMTEEYGQPVISKEALIASGRDIITVPEEIQEELGTSLTWYMDTVAIQLKDEPQIILCHTELNGSRKAEQP
ncbi:MAG: hypothetical protein LBU26_00980 [Synergistaceae bacterium]|jgi:hypothetical protein|nr:hypothetical protein [Synergistaceae bacterium]